MLDSEVLELGKVNQEWGQSSDTFRFGPISVQKSQSSAKLPLLRKPTIGIILHRNNLSVTTSEGGVSTLWARPFSI